MPGTAEAASDALELIEQELIAILPHADDAATVSGEAVGHVLRICKTQREMIRLGIHTRQMEAGQPQEQLA